MRTTGKDARLTPIALIEPYGHLRRGTGLYRRVTGRVNTVDAIGDPISLAIIKGIHRGKSLKAALFIEARVHRALLGINSRTRRNVRSTRQAIKGDGGELWCTEIHCQTSTA
jgi:hypothetical protein